MWRPIRVFRPISKADEQQIEFIRATLAESLEILKKNPPPDTFLGRKTHEPFAKEAGED